MFCMNYCHLWSGMSYSYELPQWNYNSSLPLVIITTQILFGGKRSWQTVISVLAVAQDKKTPKVLGQFPGINQETENVGLRFTFLPVGKIICLSGIWSPFSWLMRSCSFQQYLAPCHPAVEGEFLSRHSRELFSDTLGCWNWYCNLCFHLSWDFPLNKLGTVVLGISY